jgi:hypothetical protein
MSITLIDYCCFHKSDNQIQRKKTQENDAESLNIESCCKKLNKDLQNWVHITNCRNYKHEDDDVKMSEQQPTNQICKMIIWKQVNNK